MFSYTVIGSGAVGGYYGARLAQAGHTLRFLARSDYDYIRQHGLRVESVKGDIYLEKVEVYDNSSAIPESDVILVSLKTTSNRALANLLKPLVRKGSVICVMQNGLGMEDELHALFPEALIVGAMCFICSHKAAPGLVKHLDFGHITLGAYDAAATAVTQQLCDEFSGASIRTTVADSLGEARWRKLLWNIPYNGLSVVLDSDTKRIMQTPASRQLVRDVMGEVVAAAEACGFAIGEESIEKMLEYTDSMTPYAPSMKLDYDNGRTMEIEYMYGNPLAKAAAAGCAMPKTQMLAALLAFMNDYRR